MTGFSASRGDGWRKNRWRSAVTAQRPAAVPQRRAIWTAVSIAAIAGLATLAIWPWLSQQQTVVVQLSIDEFDNVLLAPLPYGREDLEAIAAAVAGRLSPRLEGRMARTLAYHTAQGITDQLRSGIAGLGLSGRDALVAVVRGQTLVAPGQSGKPQACLLAEDVGLARAVPANIVSCRDVVEAFASSPAQTTLVVLDMGDLRWDPRLGVIAGIASAQLDDEIGRWAVAGDCWVLGSHDAHEFSGVSIIDRRGIFLRAVEIGLAGRADDRQWGGDGDREVELHELARFVAAWTNAWSQQESGFDQRPVLWQAGAGRVRLDDVPRGIRIVAAGQPGKTDRPVTASVSQSGADEPGPPPEAASASEAGAEVVAGREASPQDEVADRTAPPPAPEPEPEPEPEPGLWGLLAEAGSTGDCQPIDYAPHEWKKTVAVAAAISATPRDDSPLARRFTDLAVKLEDDLRMQVPGAPEPFAVAWRNGDEHVRAALAARNRAFDLAASVVDYCGRSSGSRMAGSVARSVGPLLDAVAAVHEELVKTTGPGDAPGQLASLLANLDQEQRRLEQKIAEAGDMLIAGIAREQEQLLTADIRWFTASQLPSAEQRRRLVAAVTARSRRHHPPGAATEAGKPPTGSQRLKLSLPAPAVVGSRTQVGRPDPQWGAVADQLDRAVRLMTVFGAPAASGLAAPDLTATRAGMREMLDGAEPAPLVAAAARAGRELGEFLTGLPGKVERLSAEPVASDLAAIDAMLRLCDPRDADRMPSGAIGWPPSVRGAPQLQLAIRADEAPLGADESRRAVISLHSGEPLPDKGTLTLEFDSDRLEVRLPSGAELVSGRPLAVRSLGERRQLVLAVRPRRRLAAGDPQGNALLRAELTVGQRRGRGERLFQLPVTEQIEVAVRGRSGTVEGDVRQADDWWALAVDPLPPGGGQGEPASPAVLRLRPYPGQVTGWEIALANQTGERRDVVVELVSLGFEPGKPDAEGLAWLAVTRALEGRLPLPATARVAASSGPFVLPADAGRVAVFLQPSPSAAAKEASDGESPPTAVGPGLGLVIRDLAADPSSISEAGPDGDGKPALRPPESRRTWLLRFGIAPRRPSSYLSAAVAWNAEDRSLAIAVEPRDGNSDSLPDGAVRLRASPLRPATDASSSLLRLSKREATLSKGNPAGSLLATWNGGDDTPVEIAVEVDGYPRAFVLRADCRPVLSGVPQRPQRDWRQVELLEPEGDFRSFRPDAKVPVRLAVDLPEDMLGGAAHPLELVLMESNPPGDGRRGELVAWAGSVDRQADYALAEASPPTALALRTSVGDWSIPVQAPGFADVDVVIEARLRLQDAPSPVVARRTIVFDGVPPELNLPRQVEVERGQEAVIEIACDDGDGVRFEGRRRGASGAAWVEWRIPDGADGTGGPWQRVKAAETVRIRVPTTAIPVGRHDVHVRLTDKVGLQSQEQLCEVIVVAAPTTSEDRSALPGP